MKIENGRKFFYQWELNQRLIVDEPCTMVQFANGTALNALGVAVKEENGVRYAEVPNILLQTAADLRAYAWDDITTSVVGSTVFPVYHMEKPAQYAYTQTEVKQYDLLLKELEEKTGYYMPAVDEEGNLSWHKSMESLPDIKGANIRGPQGIQGPKGDTGEVDVDILGAYSQGRNAKYNIYTPGWKRILNIIRSTSGVLTLGATNAINGDRSIQSLGLVLTGNVNFRQVDVDTEPMIYQLYNHEQGHNNTADTTTHARITAVRVGYPSEDATTIEGSFYVTNPINCYVDVYVDFDNSQEGDHVQLMVNFAGYSDSHNCKAITEETNAVDTGYYGEPLTYYEFAPSKNADLYMPNSKASIGNMPFIKRIGTNENPVKLRELEDGVYYMEGRTERFPGANLTDLIPGIYIVKQCVGENGEEFARITCLPVAPTGNKSTSTDMHTIFFYEVLDGGRNTAEYDLASMKNEITKLKAAAKEYELIEEVTLDEDVSSFLRTADPQGNAYNFRAIRMFIRTAQSAGTAQLIFNIGSATSSSYVYYQKNNVLVSGKEQDAIYRQYNDNGRVHFEGAAGPKNNVGYFETRPTYWDREWKNVTRISLIVGADSVSIPAGTTIKIYGIRG